MDGGMMSELNLSLIQWTDRMQPRWEENATIIDDYAEAMKDGQVFPPVEVVFDGEFYWLWDGFHRKKAAEKVGINTISVNITEGDITEAEWLALGANKVHGFNRTNKDKRRAVNLAFNHPKVIEVIKTEGKPDFSDIANHCGVSQPFVSKLWWEEHPKVSIINENYNGYSFQEKVKVHSNGIVNPSPFTFSLAPEVLPLLKSTDLDQNRPELAKLAKLDPETQKEVVDKIASGEAKSVKSAKKQVASEQRIKTIKPVDVDWLLVGDFREVGQQVPSDSVDLIFTDPPYDKEHIKDYGDLACLAHRALRPGGILLAYSGQNHLPQILPLMSKYLEYMWMCGIGHSNGSTYFQKWNLDNNWKPLLMYGKLPLIPFWNRFSDFTTGGREKDRHEWQQALGEATHYIKALCPPGGFVLDPFLGSGTTLVAAKSLGLQYCGIEIDKLTASEAKERIENAPT